MKRVPSGVIVTSRPMPSMLSAAILLGGAGKDSLQGAKKRSILVGGDDADRLVGNSEDDVLIGGIVRDQIDLFRLVSVLETWNRTDKTYQQRITLLGGPSGISGLTIGEDGESDTLIGNAGVDWYMVGDGDRTNGRSNSEVLTQL